MVSISFWSAFAAGVGFASACTTLVVGKDASSDGSVMVTHSDDGESNGDPRLCAVPSRDFPAGSLHAIYYDTEEFPRYVGYDRGDCYFPKDGEKIQEPIGHIPEVEHTYAFFESTYGLVNEHGVGIGESTCSGVFGTKAVGYGGKALLSIDALTRIALGRANTSRQAVQIMGRLAEKHGFYGSDSFEGSGESLMVGDADEGFIFHILPDPTGTSAIWVAQRVPDDEVGVVANMFVIREVALHDTRNFLYSDSMVQVAKEKGWWQQGQPLDFTRIYSDGEYAHKYYSGRRVWGAFRLFGVPLPTNYTDLRYDAVYPVTAKPATAVEVRDLMAIYRDYYDGTEFDLSKGLAAGPYGNPDRWSTWMTSLQGSWERSIGLFRTTSINIVQCKRYGQGTVMWYAPHSAGASVFLPVFARSTAVPASYKTADPNTLSRESAYWAHRYVFNVAKIRYDMAIKDVRKVQWELEDEGVSEVLKLDNANYVGAGDLDRASDKLASKILKKSWELPDHLIFKYADGFLKDGEPLGYPDWWLKQVGYEQGPPPVPHECADDAVEKCTGACPPRGFATCAAKCVSICDTQAVV